MYVNENSIKSKNQETIFVNYDDEQKYILNLFISKINNLIKFIGMCDRQWFLFREQKLAWMRPAAAKVRRR